MSVDRMLLCDNIITDMSSVDITVAFIEASSHKPIPSGYSLAIGVCVRERGGGIQDDSCNVFGCHFGFFKKIFSFENTLVHLMENFPPTILGWESMLSNHGFRMMCDSNLSLFLLVPAIPTWQVKIPFYFWSLATSFVSASLPPTSFSPSNRLAEKIQQILPDQRFEPPKIRSGVSHFQTLFRIQEFEITCLPHSRIGIHQACQERKKIGNQVYRLLY